MHPEPQLVPSIESRSFDLIDVAPLDATQPPSIGVFLVESNQEVNTFSVSFPSEFISSYFPVIIQNVVVSQEVFLTTYLLIHTMLSHSLPLAYVFQLLNSHVLCQ